MHLSRHTIMRYIALFALLATTTLAQPTPPSPVGEWRGDSICQVKPSACNDEKAFYRVAAGAQPDRLAITFSKVVDGNEVVMGTINDCRYDAAKQNIRCDYPTGIWLLNVSGNKMTGSLTLKDGTVFRRVSLQRQ